MGDTNTDEQDLAKALDSVSSDLSASAAPTGGLSFEETAPSPGSEPVILPGSPIAPTAVTDVHSGSSFVSPTDDSASADDTTPAPTTEPSGPLEEIKKDALVELRPLVDKLTLSPEEKFDTYLLLIRSTDDTALIAPAHEAAKAISDETRRAEALLDIIKEIDYLSQQKKAA